MCQLSGPLSHFLQPCSTSVFSSTDCVFRASDPCAPLRTGMFFAALGHGLEKSTNSLAPHVQLQCSSSYPHPTAAKILLRILSRPPGLLFTCTSAPFCFLQNMSLRTWPLYCRLDHHHHYFNIFHAYVRTGGVVTVGSVLPFQQK